MAAALQIEPETLYIQLGRLIATMPDLRMAGPISPEANQWLGRAVALVEASGDGVGAAMLKGAAMHLDSLTKDMNIQTIASITYSALARAELRAPASAQGAFIPAGDTLNAFAAVAKVLARAQSDIFLVDAYADQIIITDFAVTAPAGVAVRTLGANREAREQAMRPAVPVGSLACSRIY